MEIKDFIFLFFGLVGTILGIINLYIEIKKQKPQALVKPYPAFRLSKKLLSAFPDNTELNKYIKEKGFPSTVAMDITNVGKVTIYIKSVGFFNPKTPYKGRFIITTGNTQPKKLEPNELWQINTELTQNLLKHLLTKHDRMFIEVGNGNFFYGTTKVFKYFIKKIRIQDLE